ncbi:unnamed protein product [Amaranthus hypochondriacus]
MNQNLKALAIGMVGVGITFSAYSQTAISSSNCIAIGFLVLIFALLIHEGFIDV